MNNKIMIVEDEAGIRDMTSKYLLQIGYDVATASSGEQALEILPSTHPNLILLDIEMPGINGFNVCEKVREQYSIPIIFLTVRRDTIDKVKCFELGGDDYVTKPFDFEELEARIKANLRRYYAYAQTQPDILKHGTLEVDLHNDKCYLNNEHINLSTTELELLIHLMKHPNQVWSQEQLYDTVWSFDALGNIDTVRVHISHLRRKIESAQTDQKYIKTVHGFGYVFNS